MNEYTDINNTDYIPGTFNIYYISDLDVGLDKYKSIKRDSSDIIYIPQPSESSNDPLNWSRWRKFVHFGLMTFITAFTAATSNDAGSTNRSLNQEYGITYESMNIGAGVLFAGVGWAAIFLAPFPYLYGRRISYFICIGVGLLGALWFSLAKTTKDFIWSQLLVGVSESCAEAHVQLSLSDIFFQHQLGSVLTIYIMATSVGTFLGPLISGYISTLLGYRWVGWLAVIISGILLVFILFGCEETYFDRKLYMKPGPNENSPTSKYGVDDMSKKYNQSFNDGTSYLDKYDEKLIDGSLEPAKPYLKRISLITKATNLKGYGFKQYCKYLALNFRMLLFPPVWLSGLFWGIQDVFLSFYLTTQDTFFYDEPWNYSPYKVSVMNVATLIGAIIGCMYAGFISDIFVLWMAKRRNGILEAEYRLYFSGAAAVLGTSGLIMFGTGVARTLPWQVIYVGLGFIGFSWGCCGDIAMAYLMDCYPEMVLEGMACTSLINNNLSCIFTFTCSMWLETSGTQNTYIALGLINLFIILLAIPMFIYGKRIRIWTRQWYFESIATRDSI